MNVVKKINYLMKENNIDNLHELSILLDVPYTTLRSILNTTDMRISNAKKICDFFNITLDELLYDNIKLLNNKDRNKINKLLKNEK